MGAFFIAILLMTTTKTVEAPVSFAGAFEFDNAEINPFAGLVRRYQSYSDLNDAEYDNELNSRGFFPWRHDWELDSQGNYDSNAHYEISESDNEWSDYTVWK